jgi:hypothetical protein
MTEGGLRAQVVSRYETFPRDGVHYWLRWLDDVDVRGHGSGRPSIFAYLSPLSELRDEWRLAHVSAGAGLGAAAVRCAVPVASLPELRLGAVFKDCVEVGALKMESRKFYFDRPSCKDALLRCDDTNPAQKPDWWKYAWTILPAKAYALGQRRNAFCLLLRDSFRQLVVPASEVFRVFCAPEGLLAEALLSGPWADVRYSIVNPSWTGRLDDRWEVGLRTGLTARSALPAAAFELSEYGKSVAGLIHAPLVSSMARTSDLQAAIPYEWAAITLDVEGVAFPEEHGSKLGLDRFLCLRIAGVTWRKPLRGIPPEIGYRLDNNNVTRHPPAPEDEEKREEDRRIPRASAPPLDDVTGAVPVHPGQPASAGVESMLIAVPPAPAFVGGPRVERMALVEPVGPPRPPRRSFPTDAADHASPTRPGPGVRGAAPLRPAAPPEPSISAFAELADALDGLVDDGSIVDWVPTSPVNDRWDTRDGFHAWCFPASGVPKPSAFRRGDPGKAVLGRVAWPYLAGTRIRTALVCRISVGDRTLHLIETERRPVLKDKVMEGFSMLLLEAAERDLELAVGRLLDIAARGRGVWPEAATWTAAWTGCSEGMVRIARHRHEYLAAFVDEGGERVPRRLDGEFLFRWITSFLATEAASARAGTAAEMNP